MQETGTLNDAVYTIPAIYTDTVKDWCSVTAKIPEAKLSLVHQNGTPRSSLRTSVLKVTTLFCFK